VYTMSLPSAGGMMLAQTLEMYPRAYLQKLGFNSGAYQHMVAEAMRASISDRMRFLGDPAFQKVDMAALISPERMKKRRARIALDRTHAIPRFDLDEHGTHHLVTADAAGNVVSLTTTVNTVFGAKYTGADSGVVLNDEMNDFTKDKDVAPFGMKESPNHARPGARPISSMTPTIVVKDGHVVLALGGSGGTTIATNVTQMVLSVLAFGHTPTQALAARRFYTPTHGPYMLLEKGVPEKTVKDLRWRGEIVGKMPFDSSAVQMIAIDQNGTKHPAADPRKHGSGMAR
jgi:gamma-glutamyltranspeptidase/glutathione hydrolase